MPRKRIPLPQRLPSRLQLGASIVEARRATGLTQEILGQRLGLQGRAIYRWERNETAPNDRHRRTLIREIYLLNPQAGLALQAAFTVKTGKAYTVVSEPLVAEPSMKSARNDNSKSMGPYLVPAPEIRKATEPTQLVLDILEFAVFKMADELDASPRRVRRALARLLERLREANVTLETIQLELTQMLARD
jgi:transcriptional regulator with XRE-family HTH domain